jgi:uncharacterized protein (UPF0333 family)
MAARKKIGKKPGQGATEYLVLLAVVLVIALIVMSLIFNNENDEALITQSDIYWRSASPIAIEEIYAGTDTDSLGNGTSTGDTKVYLKLRNNGVNAIRLVRMIGIDGNSISQYNNWDTNPNPPPHFFPENMTNIYIPGGGTDCFGAHDSAQYFSQCKRHHIIFAASGTTGNWWMPATRLCNVPRGGRFEMKTFGFEYVEYVENIPITKLQIGSVPLRAKCGNG